MKTKRAAPIGTWHVVTNDEGLILAVYGEALLSDAQAKAASVVYRTGCRTFLHHITGPKVHVGMLISMRGLRTKYEMCPDCEKSFPVARKPFLFPEHTFLGKRCDMSLKPLEAKHDH